MEPLHAPWRLDYILMPKPAPSEVSLFTQIAQSSDDVANLVLARERTCFALMNAYPYTGGHLMTVPYKPVPDFNGLTDQEILDLMLLTRRCQNALTKVMKPSGFITLVSAFWQRRVSNIKSRISWSVSPLKSGTGL